MRKKFAAFLLAATAAGILSVGSLYADETPVSEEVQEAVAEPEQTEAVTEAETEAETENE